MNILDLSDRPQFLDRIIDWNLAEWPAPERTREDVRARIFGDGTPGRLPMTLVLEHEDRPIGYATLLLDEKGRDSGRLHWIDAVYVRPEHRRRGLASRLIQAAEQRAWALGVRELFALTDLPDLYRRLGWSPIESHAGRAVDVILSIRRW